MSFEILKFNKQKQNIRYIILDLLNLPKQTPGIKAETMTTLPNKNGKLGFKTTYQFIVKNQMITFVTSIVFVFLLTLKQMCTIFFLHKAIPWGNCIFEKFYIYETFDIKYFTV